MSQYIAVVRGEGREEYVENKIRLTGTKGSAQRFDTQDQAVEAAEKLRKIVFDRKDYPKVYPWITEVDAMEVE